MNDDPKTAAGDDTRSAGWRRWRQHVFVLFLGVVIGVVLTVWDHSFPTECKGPMACIDYTGVATDVYWAILGMQAIVSSALMAFARKARHPFFAAHVASAATVVCAMFVAQGLAVRRLADIRDLQRARTHFELTMSSRAPATTGAPAN